MERFEKREFIVENEAGRLYSLLYLPNSARQGARAPLVIYAHGMGGNHTSGDAYARELASRGYAVCCPDFRGGTHSFSDGDALDMTLFSQQDDLDAVYDALVSRSDLDANNVFLMGASMGGAVAALCAGARPGLFKGIVLLYPAFNIPHEAQRAFPEPDRIPASAEFGTVTVGRAFLSTARGFDILEAACAYRGPVLMLHGTADTIVPSSYSVRAARTYKHARLQLIADAKHGFSGGTFKYAVRTIVEFLDEECDLADESGLEGDMNFAGGMGLGGMGL